MSKKRTRRPAVTPAPKPAVDEAEQPQRDNYELLLYRPKACRHCGCTKFTDKHNVYERKISGTHDGQPYNLVKWIAATCAGCGVKTRLQELHLIPEQSE